MLKLLNDVANIIIRIPNIINEVSYVGCAFPYFPGEKRVYGVAGGEAWVAVRENKECVKNTYRCCFLQCISLMFIVEGWLLLYIMKINLMNLQSFY